MFDVVGDVSEEAFILWGLGCFEKWSACGPIEGLSLPMVLKTLCRRSGLWAKASFNMCFEGIFTYAM